MRQIQNFETLAITDARRDALAIAEAGYEAIDTGNAVRCKVRIDGDELHIGDRVYRLAGRRVFFVGVGKCAVSVGRAIEDLLGDSLTAGIALDVSTGEQTNQKLETSNLEVIVGTHPLPSEANVEAAERIVEFLSNKDENDLVIMLISGGGSTLLCLHDAPMTCADESALFTELTARGAPIQDINTVRKHISRARGGALAAAAYPAEVISLIVSDVPGNDITAIASGPTVRDASTIADAQAVLERYDMAFSTGIAFIETPKEEKYFKNVANVLLLSSQDALDAMKGEAKRRGYETTVVDDRFAGEAHDIGKNVMEKLHAVPAKTVLLYAGESTVTLGENAGKGGRNQELALSVLEDIRENELILPFASDGHDNTDHAGAITDETTCAHALTHTLSVTEYLNAHRSYDFFKTTGDALITGYTGSNVSDLMIALKK